MPDWQPLRVTRFVGLTRENRSKAVKYPSASLKLENMGLSCRKMAWVAMWINDEDLLASTKADRVAESRCRTWASGNRLPIFRSSSSTNGAFSSATPTSSGTWPDASDFSRQYFKIDALGA